MGKHTANATTSATWPIRQKWSWGRHAVLPIPCRRQARRVCHGSAPRTVAKGGCGKPRSSTRDPRLDGAEKRDTLGRAAAWPRSQGGGSKREIRHVSTALRGHDRARRRRAVPGPDGRRIWPGRPARAGNRPRGFGNGDGDAIHGCRRQSARRRGRLRCPHGRRQRRRRDGRRAARPQRGRAPEFGHRRRCLPALLRFRAR